MDKASHSSDSGWSSVVSGPLAGNNRRDYHQSRHLRASTVVPRHNKYGQLLSRKKRQMIADRKGVCLTCGIATHTRRGLWWRRPKNNADVHHGVCIRCNRDSLPADVWKVWNDRQARPSSTTRSVVSSQHSVGFSSGATSTTSRTRPRPVVFDASAPQRTYIHPQTSNDEVSLSSRTKSLSLGPPKKKFVAFEVRDDEVSLSSRTESLSLASPQKKFLAPADSNMLQPQGPPQTAMATKRNPTTTTTTTTTTTRPPSLHPKTSESRKSPESLDVVPPDTTDEGPPQFLDARNLRNSLGSELLSASSFSTDLDNSTTPHTKTAVTTTPMKELEDQVKEYVKQFDDPLYQADLRRLRAESLKYSSLEEFAREIYTQFRDSPEDPLLVAVNDARKRLLRLLYELVDEWNEYENTDDYSRFEEAIAKKFKSYRVENILMLCLPMDRAQSLYKMTSPSATTTYGLHWYSKKHLEHDTEYARQFPEEQKEWKQLVSGYTGRPTMNKRLFQLLYSNKLDLQKNGTFARWSRPQRATDEHRVTEHQ